MTASAALHATAVRIGLVPRSGMIAAARATKAIASDEARAATGDGRMSGIGRRGARLRARDEIRDGPGGTTTCRVQGLPVGGWAMLTSGAAAHTVRPRARRRTATGRPAAMGGGLPHPVNRAIDVRATGGRGTWRRVRARAEDLVPQIFRDEVARAVHG